MRWLFVTTDYPSFLTWWYRSREGLASKSYADQGRSIDESLFGVADFYSANIRMLGHDAADIHVNNEPQQRAWAAERGLELRTPPPRLEFRMRRRIVPWISVRRTQTWLYDVLRAQIREYHPDVLFNHDLNLDSAFFREVKGEARLLVGQHASPLAAHADLSPYDLLLSSLPNLVDTFRREGVRSELFRLGFEPRVLQSIGPRAESIDVSFVGSLMDAHGSRAAWLEAVCRQRPVDVWVQDTAALRRLPAVRKAYRGTVWGPDMYRVLQASRITLNHHIDAAGRWANNMRLFEATGIGAMLLTDNKANLPDMFEAGREVATYSSAAECAELIDYYLEHPDERRRIARAGQERTLREHTYAHRMRELVDLVSRVM